MLVYAVHEGGRYVRVEDSLKEKPEGKRGFYVNITNRCNCSCTFCLRSMKHMAEESTLWLKQEPTAAEVEAELDKLPWATHVSEIIFCGFGEPTMRLDVLLELMKYVKEHHPEIPTRLNTNGLSDLLYGRDTAKDFKGILDTISISLNASNAQRYLELTRAKYGIQSFDAMLKFATDCKAYIPNVVLTVVEKVENQQEIDLCQKICYDRGLRLRVRIYEDS